MPAFRIHQLRKIDTHLHGWDVAGKCLSVLSNDRGVILDDFVESTFLWHGEESYNTRLVPYREHWVGFVHNPPGSPPWPSIAGECVRNLNMSPFWREKSKHCLGLYTLTQYLANWVISEWGVPCEVVRYPTIRPGTVFSPEAFLQQTMPTIACVGFWLRRFSSFDALRANGYRKLRPRPRFRKTTQPADIGWNNIRLRKNERQYGSPSMGGPYRSLRGLIIGTMTPYWLSQSFSLT